MALTYRLLTSGTDTTNAISFTTAPFTPSPNALLFLVVGYTGSGPQPLPNISSSNDAAQWSDVQTATAARAISMFHRISSDTPVEATVTITNSAGVEYTSCMWAVFEFTGAVITGVNGVDGIIQEAIANSNSLEASVTLPNAPTNPENASVLAYINQLTDAANPGPGFTIIADLKQGAPNSTTFSQRKIPAQQTATAPFSLANAWRAIHIEVAAAEGGGEPPPAGMLYYDTGTELVQGTLHYDNGTSWVEATPQYDSGAAWIPG